MKLVVLALVVFVVLWLVRRAQRGESAPPPPPPAAPRRAPPKIEDMVRCAECGLILPRSDAIVAGQASFCGEPHRLAFTRREPAP